MPGGDKQIQDQSQTGIGTQTGSLSNQSLQNTTQTGQTGPWSATQPLLARLLQGYGGLPTDVTAGQSGAVGELQTAANSIPNFGGAAAGGVEKLFGSDTTPQQGMLSDALKTYTANIGGTAAGNDLDPYKTPGFFDALTTMQNDITNRVKGVYAGSGRDPSGAGAFAKTLGRGLEEGIAPVIASQFNQNKANQMSAAGNLFGAGSGTAGAITQQQQTPLQNIMQGIGMLPNVSSSFLLPGQAQLGAASTANSLPYGNLSQMLAPLLSIAGLGQTTSTTGTGATTGTGSSSGTNINFGQGHGETTQPQNMFSNIMGGITGAAGLASLFGGAGGVGSMLPLLALSDVKSKEGIEKIGMLHDGQNVVRFRYKGQPKTHIGLIAQDVEKREPGAVHEVAGLKMVDHKRATDRAAAMAA